MILSFGGIPLLYYGDEIGVLNDYSCEQDEHKRYDSRWIHRPNIDWDKAELRKQPGSVEYRIFTALKKMITVRKEIPAFADFNSRELLDVNNPHLLAFSHVDHQHASPKVLVIGNFDGAPQHLDLKMLRQMGFLQLDGARDLCSGESPPTFNDQLVIPAYGFYWLVDTHS